MPYSDEVYIEQSADQYTLSDWRIDVGDEQPGGESFSLSGSEATIQVQLAWNKVRSFVRFILGWSYADRSYPYRLRRELPQYHPRFAFLRATSVSLTGVAPAAVHNKGSKVSGAYANALADAAYQKVHATVRFTAQPWAYLFDDFATTPADEARRYTYFDPVPSVEVISAEGLNNIAFANGPSAGVAVPAPFGTLMSKTLKTLNWMQVPNEYVSGGDPLQFTPSKIDACVGRVNSATFLGHPAGTLLLQAPQYERFQFPIQTAGGTLFYYGWNIKLPMQFFDPPRGYDTGTISGNVITLTSTVAPPGEPRAYTYLGGQHLTIGTGVGDSGPTGTTVPTTVTSITGSALTVGTGGGLSGTVYVYNDAYRGHQLVPRRADLLWYGAVREKGSAKLYPEADFATIFQHVNYPTGL